MELFWVFVAVVIADVISTLLGFRVGLEDVWFGRRAAPMFILAVVQIAGFYVIMMLLPLVPYLMLVVYAVVILRAAVVVWNVYLIISHMQEEKTMFFSFPFFSGQGFWRRSRSPRGS